MSIHWPKNFILNEFKTSILYHGIHEFSYDIWFVEARKVFVKFIAVDGFYSKFNFNTQY